MKNVLPLILLFFCLQSFSQMGKLKCVVSPPYAVIKLNDSIISNYAILAVDTGEYVLKVFLNKYLPEQIVINVQSDSLNLIHVRLKRDPVYVQYRKDLKSYKTKNALGVGFPVFLSGSSLIGLKISLSVNSKNRLNQYDAVINAESDYYSNINYQNIEDLKTEFYSKQEKYSKLTRRRNVLIFSGCIVSSTLLGVTVYSIVKAIKREKPNYNEGEAKAKAMYLAPFYSPQGELGINFVKTF